MVFLHLFTNKSQIINDFICDYSSDYDKIIRPNSQSEMSQKIGFERLSTP
jgi:hypothetical protein